MRSPQIKRRKTSENDNLVLPAPKRSSVGVQTLNLVKEHLLGLTNLTKRASHGQTNQRWYNIRVLNQHKKMNGWTQFEVKNEWRHIQFMNQQKSHWENSLVCPEFDVGPSIYVGGIDPECCAEDLQDFCKDVCPLMGCRVMPSRRTGTRCAYIEVDETKVETFRSIIWPENLYARDWSFSERDGQQTKNK